MYYCRLRPLFLTRPDKTHEIICCNFKDFRKEAIFHGGISLYNVPSLSHTKDIFYGGMLIFFWKKGPRFEQEHVSSVLKCSSKLCGVQCELKICMSVNSFSFRVTLHSATYNIGLRLKIQASPE